MIILNLSSIRLNYWETQLQIGEMENAVLRDTTITVLLKYLSNFWRSLEMPLINCKVELKLKLKKYCVLVAVCVDNTETNPDNIIFTIKDARLYVPVVTLSARDSEKLSKLLNKGYERSVYWNECKTKIENKNTTKQYRYFPESKFVGINRLFMLVYSNNDNDCKRSKTRRYYLPKTYYQRL